MPYFQMEKIHHYSEKLRMGNKRLAFSKKLGLSHEGLHELAMLQATHDNVIRSCVIVQIKTSVFFHIWKLVTSTSLYGCRKKEAIDLLQNQTTCLLVRYLYQLFQRSQWCCCRRWRSVFPDSSGSNHNS